MKFIQSANKKNPPVNMELVESFHLDASERKYTIRFKCGTSFDTIWNYETKDTMMAEYDAILKKVNVEQLESAEKVDVWDDVKTNNNKVYVNQLCELMSKEYLDTHHISFGHHDNGDNVIIVYYETDDDKRTYNNNIDQELRDEGFTGQTRHEVVGKVELY